MNRALIVFAVMTGYAWTADLSAQSTVVSSGSTSVALPQASARVGEVALSETIPTSIPLAWSRWESVLNRTFPDRFNGPRKAGDVVDELRLLGLPIVISQSAADDSLTATETIELKISSQPLETRLRQALGEKNADLVFRSDSILIISLDDADDSRHFMTITYDVSGMGVNPDWLIDTIQETVVTDSWYDTGQGLGAIRFLSVRGRDLLVVSQSYEIHQRVRSLLNGLDRLTGTGRTRNFYDASRSASQYSSDAGPGASPVVVPQRNVNPRPGAYSSGGFFNVADEPWLNR